MKKRIVIQCNSRSYTLESSEDIVATVDEFGNITVEGYVPNGRGEMEHTELMCAPGQWQNIVITQKANETD